MFSLATCKHLHYHSHLGVGFCVAIPVLPVLWNMKEGMAVSHVALNWRLRKGDEGFECRLKEKDMKVLNVDLKPAL